MYTQCPECQTIFEIDEEALQTSLGIVHCGRCFKRFDALSTLSDTLPEQDDEALPAHDPAEHAPILTEAVESPRDTGGRRKRRHHEAITVTRPPVALESSPRIAEASAPVPSRPVLDAGGDTPEDLVAVRAPVASRDTADDASAQDWRTIDLGDVVDPPDAFADTVPADPGTIDSTAPAAPGSPSAASGDPGAGGADATADVVDGTPESEVDARAAAHVYVPPRQRIARASFAWVAIMLVLALALAAQLAWIGRVQLLRDPATHAWVARACTVIDCRIPLIADAAKLELLSRDVRPDPAATGALTITATLRNNATFRQPWPIVTVTLTDLENRPVAMRRFRPVEYMSDPARRAAGIAPGATAAVAFEVADPGKDAVAFQFAFE